MRLHRLPRAAVPPAVLAAGLLLTLLSAAFAHRTGRAQESLAFENVAASVRHAVESRLEAHIAILRGGAGLFAASEEVSPADFRAYVSRLELPSRYPGVQGIGFTTFVQPEARERVAASVVAGTGRPFRFWPGEDPAIPVHAIIFLEPLDARNELALGYDMSSEPVRRAAMERARDTAMPAATGRVRLVQERAQAGPGQYGFLIYVPVYRAGEMPATLEERHAGLFGFVYSPFRADDLLRGIVGRNLDGLYLAVHDGSPADGLLLHQSLSPAPDPSRLGVVRTIDVAGRPWTLVIQPAVDPGVGLLDLFVLLFACGGALLSALLFTVTRAEMRGREAAERAARELRASGEALRLANRAKDDFLAVVSHELRTPLNAILGWSLMLRRGQVPPERTMAALETIHRNAQVQVKLVEDLLDMSQALAGHIRLDLQAVDPAAVFGAVAESVRPLSHDRHVRLEWHAAGDLGTVRADPSRLEQIAWNLLANAIKFTPAGGAVRMSAWREDATLVLEVRDTGVGIPHEMLEEVFAPFRQGDASSTRAHGGVGLGLSIARHLVQLHGGVIAASSEGKNRGAVFTVRLPAAAGNAAAGTAASSNAAGQPAS